MAAVRGASIGAAKLGRRGAGRKVLLVTPPYHAGVLESAGRWPHLGFIYIAGHLRAAGFQPLLYDAMTKGHTLDQIRRRLAEEQPAYVGCTSYTSSIYAALDVLRAAKEVVPGVVTFLGGVHAHFMYEEVLQDPAVDYVVRGEGEETLPELLQVLEEGRDPAGAVRGVVCRRNGRIVRAPDRPLLPDLDTLLPAWDLVEWQDYTFFPIPRSRLAVVSSSRGCPHDCSFCSQQKFWERSYRERDPVRFVNELEFLARQYGVNVFLLSDEYPTRNGERWERILDEIIRRDLQVTLLMETRVGDILRDAAILPKYRRAGVMHIYVGVEATNQETLDRFKKDVRCQDCVEAIRLINEHGMVTECSFVLGMPDDTPETIARTLELARHYNPDMPHFLHIAPWPYSDLYQELKDYLITRDYSKYNFVEPVVAPRAMSAEEISAAVIDCYRRFYLAKAREYLAEKDERKRQYLLRSAQVMMSNSFLAKHLGLGQMPAEIKALLPALRGERRKAAGGEVSRREVINWQN